MIQETGQDGGLQTDTPYKSLFLAQALFGRMSTEADVGRIVESTNVHNKLRVCMLFLSMYMMQSRKR